MRLESDLTLNGSDNVQTFVQRLRDLADQVEAEEAAMAALPTSPAATIKGGGNLVYKVTVQGEL